VVPLAQGDNEHTASEVSIAREEFMRSEELKTLNYEMKEGIAYIALNRPEVSNAINHQMVNELSDVWENIREDGAVEVVILTGVGKAFCVGADLKDMARERALEHFTSFRPYRHSWNTPLSPKAHYLFKPVIVAVNGLCGPGGLEFVSEAEITICSEEATFTDAHASVGVTVHSGVALAKRVPYNHIMYMALMGAHLRIDAKRAYEIGLVNEVTSPERLMSRATEIAQTIMLNSPTVVQASVEALWHSLSLGFRDAMQLANYMQRLYARHPDFVEGAKAFMEKRQPVWKNVE
jgi:enoyl-CoA hydratase/carnithine racemase